MTTHHYLHDTKISRSTATSYLRPSTYIADISVAIFQLDLADLSVVINSVLTSRSPIAGDAVVRSGFRETEMGINNLRTAKWRTGKMRNRMRTRPVIGRDVTRM